MDAVTKSIADVFLQEPLRRGVLGQSFVTSAPHGAIEAGSVDLLLYGASRCARHPPNGSTAGRSARPAAGRP